MNRASRLALAGAFVLAACSVDRVGTDEARAEGTQSAAASAPSQSAGSTAPARTSNFALTETADPVDLAALPAALWTGNRTKDVLTAQVLLDRARFSPGVIDGMGGENTRQAVEAYERANGLTVDGKIDPQLIERLKQGDSGQVLRRYTITEDDVNGPFVDQIPDDFSSKAKLERLAYTGVEEKLGEKFHMDVNFLKTLNPNTDFSRAGTKIVVVARGDDALGAKVARIEVHKTQNSIRAYDQSGKLVAFYPATVGSDTLPSPSGSMKVRAIAPDPVYYFNPEGRSWGPDKKLQIAPGPNNPVGSVWIDLTKDGYGLHGSPEPALIAKTASHGCVRLTNWDAEELASAVEQGVVVEFVG